MKDGSLNKQEREALLRAARILNKWCDWENGQREKADFDPMLDDVESSAAGAAGLISEFIYDTRGM